MPTDRSPRVDAQLARVLQAVAAIEAGSGSWGLPDAERRRRVSELSAQHLPARGIPGLQRSDCYVSAPGREIPLRLYRSARATAPTRAMLYFHGGGWVVGSIATHDALCAELAERTGYLVASVHYRRAPEHAHPAQHEDGWAALDWLARHAALLGVDPVLPMALGGDSAGAHLALGCARRAQGGKGPQIDRMLLFYPAVDPATVAGPVRRAGSVQAYGAGPGLTLAAMDYYWRALLGPAPDRVDALALPLSWPAGERLPPAVLVTAEIDLLRDEGEAYARRLADAGTEVAHWRAPGMVHGFARMLEASAAARRHVRRACRELLALGARPSDQDVARGSVRSA